MTVELKKLNADIKQVIRKELGLERPNIAEAFVATPKQFDVSSLDEDGSLTRKAFNDHITLYQGYVETFNSASAQLDSAQPAEANSNGSIFRALKQAEMYNLNGVLLHELFFANIGDVSSQLYSDSLAFMRLNRDWGDLANWQRDFVYTAEAAREGWAVCCFHLYLKRYVNVVVDSHNIGIPVGCIPVIVLDVWSHAYAQDFGANKKSYIRQMMKQFNWDVIEERFEKAEAVHAAVSR